MSSIKVVQWKERDKRWSKTYRKVQTEVYGMEQLASILAYINDDPKRELIAVIDNDVYKESLKSI